MLLRTGKCSFNC